ncbi:ArsR family transcriptional regulator [miscellaneous Crenarchaeota group-15 archaeon DG-45]|uniref:ArsR family transcriptional regulator n=1 Tax=miscellaneous Crenarchaeota group-15 archaeon DG-45 TaxID=1685127 RepID=A0A0M0BNR3_9ARCH|nr:MAG: ArsR family transcriptional regulator [miscellaneous Crenarchaeota group-15 archaeon DG-45]
MASRNRSFNHLLQWLIAGTRGGVNRARIIRALREAPQNANQLSSLLEVDYRTVRHHLDILEEHGLITSMGERYGKMYFISHNLDESYEDFEEIWNKIGKRLKKRDEE